MHQTYLQISRQMILVSVIHKFKIKSSRDITFPLVIKMTIEFEKQFKSNHLDNVTMSYIDTNNFVLRYTNQPTKCINFANEQYNPNTNVMFIQDAIYMPKFYYTTTEWSNTELQIFYNIMTRFGFEVNRC